MSAFLKSRAKEVVFKYPLHAAAITLVSLALAALLLYLWLFRNPENFEDCIWAAAKAPTKEGAIVAARFCHKKFRDEARALEPLTQ